MGKASSSKKVARAARAAGRPGAKKSYAWPMAITGVVILGVILVVLSFGGGNNDTSKPQAGDHWHAAYGVYVCGAYLPPFPQEAQDIYGIHTHGEGLMHIHPFTSLYYGKNANVGAFASDVNLSLTDTSFTAKGLIKKNGEKCGTKPGHVELVTWKSRTDKVPTIRLKDLAKYNPPDLSVWALAFVADGTTVPLPPSVENLKDPTAVENGRQPATAKTTTTAASSGSTPTTAPASTSSTLSTATTAKP